MIASLRVIEALVRRALNEITRVPGAAVPGVLAPTIFLVGLSGVFGEVKFAIRDDSARVPHTFIAGISQK